MENERLLTDEQLNVILHKKCKQLDDLRIIAETQYRKTRRETALELFDEIEKPCEHGWINTIDGKPILKRDCHDCRYNLKSRFLKES